MIYRILFITSLILVLFLVVSKSVGKNSSASKEAEQSPLLYTTFFEVDDEQEQIENSLLVLFRREIKEDVLGGWICEELAFSDDRNRSSRLKFEAVPGSVRVLVLGNANEKRPIRDLLNMHMLEQEKLPDLETMQQLLRQVKELETGFLMKDTTLFLPSDKTESVLKIRLDQV